MYHVSARGVDERMINVHYYYRSRKVSASSQFFVGAEMAASSNRQITSCVSFVTAHIPYASINKTKTELIWNSFCIRGRHASCLRVCLDATLLPQSYQCSSLLQGVDSVGGQMRGDKECPSQWRNQFWKSLEEGGGKRCLEFGSEPAGHDTA